MSSANRLIGIIAMGLATRMMPQGLVLWDKYLGDALYAAMVYEVLRLLWGPKRLALWAMAVMTVIELFQLTGIPAALVGSENLLGRVAGRLLGTHFSLLDLAAYMVGIGCMWLWDSRRATSGTAS